MFSISWVPPPTGLGGSGARSLLVVRQNRQSGDWRSRGKHVLLGWADASLRRFEFAQHCSVHVMCVPDRGY
jgi:hypothetical protein